VRVDKNWEVLGKKNWEVGEDKNREVQVDKAREVQVDNTREGRVDKNCEVRALRRKGARRSSLRPPAPCSSASLGRHTGSE
jgi:hypothetical protein